MKEGNKKVTAIRAVVYLIAIVGIGAWAWKNFKPTTPEPAPSATTESSEGNGNIKPSNLSNESGHVVLVTYFTSNVRCPTCLKIEKLTKESLQKAFSKELASKEVVFQTLNFDKPENKHFVKDYQLAFKTVVISDLQKGKEVKWSKYDKVWNLVNTPEQFEAYLTDGINKYLKP